MKLLIAIINNPDLVVDILDEFYKDNIKGATVIESTGMAHMIADHIPFFSRFAEFGKDPGHNKTIFLTVPTEEYLKKAVDAIEKIVGDLNKPETGIVMTLPIDFCKGLVKTEGDESL
ncbi:hypothetical protein RH915_03960 [Serpentinicella sp. ANB-PHB4]|uniref:hypothetical protein n=1 Tax=Serpentinicella sp. ANB-PHB4 TaxID=3074076 RepID=UPI00285BC532|nr:hypothetical protein [Serpentinicella sp. ANB-PHB4]MDR5658636.1 hypothetical protein [Serpentinicella sp. ANB-PHB4]